MKVLLFIMVLFSGCSLLKPVGKNVLIWTHPTEHEMTTIEKVGKVTCKSELMAVPNSTNEQRCKDQLKNATGELGGNVLIINKKNPLSGGGVEMFATSYVEKSIPD